jgi:hypothetical protein
LLVNHLIDSGMTALEIKTAFGSKDRDIIEALSYFAEDDDEEEEDDDDDDIWDDE